MSKQHRTLPKTDKFSGGRHYKAGDSSRYAEMRIVISFIHLLEDMGIAYEWAGMTLSFVDKYGKRREVGGHE